MPVGDSVRIICPIWGQPAPMITWSKGNEAITDYLWERFSLDKKSLTISKLQYDDTGIYICKGTNGYGSNEVRIDLFVIGKMNEIFSILRGASFVNIFNLRCKLQHAHLAEEWKKWANWWNWGCGLACEKIWWMSKDGKRWLSGSLATKQLTSWADR